MTHEESGDEPSPSPGMARASNRASRLKKNIAAAGFSGIAGIAAQIAALPLSIALVGAADYAQWAVMFAVLQVLVILDLGLGPALIRHSSAASTADAAGTITRTALILTMAWSGIVTVLAGAALLTFSRAGVIPAPPELILIALLIGYGPAALGRWAQARLHSAQLFTVEKGLQVSALVVRLLGLVVLGWADMGLTALAVLESATFAMPGVLALIVGGKAGDLPDWRSHSYSPRDARRLLRFGSRASALGAMVTLGVQAPVLLAGAITPGPDTTAVAAAVRVQTALRQSQAWVAEPLLPALSQIADRVDSKRALEATWAISLISAAVSAPLIVFSELLSVLWLGERLGHAAAPVVQAVAVATIISSLHIVPQVLMSAGGRPGYFGVAIAAWLALQAGACGIGLAVAGPAGAAGALILATVVSEVIFGWFIVRGFGASALWRTVQPMLLGATAFVVLAYVGLCLARLNVDSAKPLHLAAAGISIYAFTILIAGFLTLCGIKRKNRVS